jgi:hypothetical protein
MLAYGRGSDAIYRTSEPYDQGLNTQRPPANPVAAGKVFLRDVVWTNSVRGGGRCCVTALSSRAERMGSGRKGASYPKLIPGSHKHAVDRFAAQIFCFPHLKSRQPSGMAPSASTEGLMLQELQEGTRVRIQEFSLRSDHEADDRIFSGLQKANEVEEQRAMMDRVERGLIVASAKPELDQVGAQRYVCSLSTGPTEPLEHLD